MEVVATGCVICMPALVLEVFRFSFIYLFCTVSLREMLLVTGLCRVTGLVGGADVVEFAMVELCVVQPTVVSGRGFDISAVGG